MVWLLIDSFGYFLGQSLITYLLLAVTYLTLFCCQKRDRSEDGRTLNLWQIFKGRGLRYFFMAVVDVESNYLMHRAFHYTTLTSVQVSLFYIAWVVINALTFVSEA